MPARRPYASRGVPRRATTRRPGGPRLKTGLATLLALGGAIALSAVWFGNPFAALGPTRSASALSAPTGGGVAGPPVAGAAAELQMADVSAHGPVAGPNQQASSNTAAATVPITRHWDLAVSDPALAGRLDQAILGIDGRVSLAVRDLGTGHGAVLDGDRELPAASLYKLPVLYTAFEAGLSMNEPLPITEDARAYDAGTMELGVGETLTVAEALERMVTLSDNTAAVMLGSRVGGVRINATLAGLGMDTTHYSLERMTTSALDMLHLLDLMARGKAVSPDASADMVHLLLRQRVNDRLPRLLPGDVRVAHKTGNLPGTVNDVGILYGPTTTVAVAALVSDTTDEATAATGIARAALAAYTYFDDQPEAPGRPTIPRAPTRPIPPVWREPRPVPTLAPTLAPTADAGDESADGSPARPGAGLSGQGQPTEPTSSPVHPPAPAATATPPGAAAPPATATPGKSGASATSQPTQRPAPQPTPPPSTPPPSTPAPPAATSARPATPPPAPPTPGRR